MRLQREASNQKTPEQLKLEIGQLLAAGLGDLNTQFSPESTNALFDSFTSSFTDSIANDTWMICFPGKILFNMFCGSCFFDGFCEGSTCISRHCTINSCSRIFRHNGLLSTFCDVDRKLIQVA